MYKDIINNKKAVYYFSGGAVSQIGDILSGLAFLFLAYRMTGSSIHTTIVAIAETTPYLLFGLFGGALADHINRRNVMVIIDLIRLIVLTIIIFFYIQDWLTYPHLLVGGFLLQCCGCFFNPAHRAVLPAIIPEEKLSAANSAWDTIQRTASLIGPILAAWLLASADIIYFFVIDAASYAISALCLSRLPTMPPTSMEGRLSIASLYRSVFDFFKWISKKPVLLHLYITTFFVVFFNTWVWQVGILLAFEEITQNGEPWYNALQIAFGIGATIISMLIPLLIKRLDMKKYILGCVIWGLGISIIGSAYMVPFFFVGAILIGIGLPISSLTRVYLIQTHVPKVMLGRAFSSNAVLLYAANTLSLALYAVLLSFLSIRSLILVSGAGILVIVCFYMLGMFFRKKPGV
ncbi:Transmembrane secretion effector [Terribacillus saccharophilus]|uniref:Transmembrane secretion effector n=1 Tax=Terribacillus saccharophilus TaxID=361277 RepID=A0AAX2EKH8_9BACI|nr:MFS transporter [Terribacillus saccharophilus]MCM3227619.1 MFS transporter [Terribacillus saccharophilus]MEC0282549.1 MFS transporter [Terribacillus saccharophilus]MEC0292305.1 MFS transporter [Terribacillus saccharophilus]SEO19589.1 Transmembrane secretion effector [Terribacillus saccharophilus]